MVFPLMLCNGRLNIIPYVPLTACIPSVTHISKLINAYENSGIKLFGRRLNYWIGLLDLSGVGKEIKFYTFNLKIPDSIVVWFMSYFDVLDRCHEQVRSVSCAYASALTSDLVSHFDPKLAYAGEY